MEVKRKDSRKEWQRETTSKEENQPEAGNFSCLLLILFSLAMSSFLHMLSISSISNVHFEIEV